jgi:hypothetical protein
VNEGKASLSDGYFDDLCFLIYPPAKGAAQAAAVEYEYAEDDGESDFLPGSHNAYRVRLSAVDADTLACSFKPEAFAAAPPKRRRTFRFRVPAGFAVSDASGRTYGAEYRTEFLLACGAVELSITGSYAQEGRI